ncbi:glycosyltransferase family 1 protein [Desulfocurvus sp.]|uniref:glycosyltransferase n=1 Tax=Desulfocurvus sp. TaxID=2871698 RepID=UPI0025C542D1|nr:glycosyltransferase family 1 protein [Desulfocurvus sp.]MCK9240511.1 glycosyltransferase family 1 protein [Desulfocurvus sp.]
MSNPTGTTHIFLPPLASPTGGLAVLHQIAAHLHAAGRPVALVPREAGFWRPEFSRAVPVVPWADLALARGDIWLVPEGWVNALAPGLHSGARTVLYVQNWAYLFSALPPDVRWDQLPVEFLAVSDPVARFVEYALGVRPPVVRPAVDPARFRPPAAPRPASPVTVAYMPRKNKALATQIRAVAEARAARDPGAPALRWLEIAGQPPDGVAELLRRAHIFLATGFPEGCPLPPLEAMASGCLVVGFTGLGGQDSMRQAADLPGALRPWLPQRPVPWGGQGLFCADADVLGAAQALETAVRWVAGNHPALAGALDAARATAAAYSPEAQRREVLAAWDALTARG